MNEKQIELWYDETSGDDMWCVSLCDATGDEERCLSTHETESQAEWAAEAEAQSRGLVAYARSTVGQLTRL